MNYECLQQTWSMSKITCGGVAPETGSELATLAKSAGRNFLEMREKFDQNGNGQELWIGAEIITRNDCYQNYRRVECWAWNTEGKKKRMQPEDLQGLTEADDAYPFKDTWFHNLGEIPSKDSRLTLLFDTATATWGLSIADEITPLHFICDKQPIRQEPTTTTTCGCRPRDISCKC